MISLERIIKLTTEAKRPLGSEELERMVSVQEDASLRSPGVEAHYYRFFYFLAKEAKFKTIVELGTHTGISSACLAEGDPAARVVTVDHDKRVMPHARRANIEYLVQDSLVPAGGVKDIDLLFIDTDHDGVRCKAEYNLYLPLMAEKGLIFFDDIHLGAPMDNFWLGFMPAKGKKIELPVHGAAGFGMVYID